MSEHGDARWAHPWAKGANRERLETVFTIDSDFTVCRRDGGSPFDVRP